MISKQQAAKHLSKLLLDQAEWWRLHYDVDVKTTEKLDYLWTVTASNHLAKIFGVEEFEPFKGFETYSWLYIFESEYQKDIESAK